MNFGIVSGDIVKISNLMLSKNNNSYLYTLIQPWGDKQNIFKIIFTKQLATEFNDKYCVGDSVMIEVQLNSVKNENNFYNCTLFANSFKKIESKILNKVEHPKKKKRISDEELKQAFYDVQKLGNPQVDASLSSENEKDNSTSIKSDNEPDINEFYDFSKNLI